MAEADNLECLLHSKETQNTELLQKAGDVIFSPAALGSHIISIQWMVPVTSTVERGTC